MTNLNVNNTNTNTSTNANVNKNIIIDDKTVFVNLTPHAVVFKKIDGSLETIQSSGVARVSTSFEVQRIVRGIVIGETTYSGITGLPDPQPDTLFIVSLPLLKAAPDRTDLIAPNDCVRNEQGLVSYANSGTR